MNGETLFSASIQGGILAAVVWLIVLAMPAMPPVAKVWLWRLVFLKFALGFVGIGNIPLRVLPPEPASAPEVGVSDSVAYETADADIVQTPIVLEAAPKREIPWNLLWLAGVGAVGAYAFLGIGRTARIVRRAKPVEETWLLQTLDELCLGAGVRKTPRLMESAETKTALLAWSLRPVILLPAGLVKGGSDVSVDIRLMLAHEVAHLANRDLAWNLLSTGIKGLFFFHPLVWLSAGRSRVAQETAADERAVRMTGTSLKLYGEMLLRATVAADTLRAMPGVVAMAGSVRSLRERLDAMGRLSERPPLALRLAAFAAILALFPGYCLVARAQEPPVPSPARRLVVQKPASERSATLWKLPKASPFGAGWIRFDPATGNVTDGWHLQGSAAKPVWWRIDPVTKKRVTVHGVGYWSWAQVKSGKVVAKFRGPGGRVKIIAKGLPAAAGGGLAPSHALPPQNPIGGRSLPRPAAPGANPFRGKGVPGLAPQPARDPLRGKGRPGLAPSPLGGGAVPKLAPGRPADPFVATGGRLPGQPAPLGGAHVPPQVKGEAAPIIAPTGSAVPPQVKGEAAPVVAPTGSAVPPQVKGEAVPVIAPTGSAVPPRIKGEAAPVVAPAGLAAPAPPAAGGAVGGLAPPVETSAPAVRLAPPAPNTASKRPVPAKPKAVKKKKKGRPAVHGKG